MLIAALCRQVRTSFSCRQTSATAIVLRLSSRMAKPKVYVTREINKEAADLLNETCEVTTWTGPGSVPREELLKNITDKAGLFCCLTDKIDKEVLDAGTSLRVVASMAVGYDHLDVKEIGKRGIKIGYTPDVLTDATAELTLALLLATSRRLFEASEEARTGGWKSWAPFWMCGPGLKDSTVGIVGFGRIGQTIAGLIKPFKPKRIIFHNRSPRLPEAQKLGATRVPFDELLAESDFVIAACSLTPETDGLFNSGAFRKMKPNAIFVNSSRGAVVDQDALVEALENDRIWGAGLDVTTPEPLPVDHPLFKMKNCVVLPHIGSATIGTRNAMGLLTAENLLAGLKGESMPCELKP